MTPRDAVDSVARLDDEQSRELVAWLNRPDNELEDPAHREIVNGRYVVVLEHGAQTYCLLPLAVSVPPGVPEGRGPG